MKIKYEFANEEHIEIEVDEKWGHIVLDLDRQEYNNDHTESRRHCSFDLYTENGNEVADTSIDVLEEVINNATLNELYHAMSRLTPFQKHVIEEHFFKGKTQTEIAHQEGVSIASVHQAIERGKKKLKKFLKNPFKNCSPVA